VSTREPRSVSVAGCTVHYLEAGSGPQLVLLHGGGGMRVDDQAWTGLTEHYRLLAPSLPGFDQSTAGTTASMEDVADVTAELIRTVCGGSAAVIGESFGGMVGALVAIRHPEVVTRLVLVAPAGLRQDDGPSILHLTREQRSELVFGKPPGAPPDPEQLERSDRNRQTVRRLMHGRPQFDPSFQEQLAHIQAPTLLVWGSADKMTWPTQAKYFAERIPQVRLALIEGAPHAVQAAYPREFLDAVLPFLAASDRLGDPRQVVGHTLPS